MFFGEIIERMPAGRGARSVAARIPDPGAGN